MRDESGKVDDELEVGVKVLSVGQYSTGMTLEISPWENQRISCTEF